MVKPVRIEESGGITRPQQYEDKPEYGEVVAHGDVCKYVKVGDIVLFQKYSTEKVRDPDTGVDYMLLKEEDVRCIV